MPIAFEEGNDGKRGRNRTIECSVLSVLLLVLTCLYFGTREKKFKNHHILYDLDQLNSANGLMVLFFRK